MKSFGKFLKEDLGLSAEIKKETETGLENLLADLHVASIKIHNFHWNVEGSFFGPLHKLFDDLYGNMNGHIDKVAERIRAIDDVTPGSMKEFLDLTSLKEADGKKREHPEMLRMILIDLESMSKSARSLVGKVKEDEGTMNLLADFIESIDKDAWFVRSHLK